MVKLTFCSAKGCKDFAWCRDLCFKHFMQLKRSDGFTPRFILKANECSHDGCANKKVAKGLCWKHYRRTLRNDYKRATWLCLILHAVPYWQCHARGCKRFKKTKNFCTLHYQRYRKWGKLTFMPTWASGQRARLSTALNLTGITSPVTANGQPPTSKPCKVGCQTPTNRDIVAFTFIGAHG